MFKIVISDPKTRKAYQIEKELPILIGMKIGDTFDGSPLGLTGFKLEITGGSDKDGVPMRKDLEGTMRRKALLTKGTGFRGYKIKKKRGKKIKVKIKGMRKRKYIRGNTISNDIAQVNVKIIEGEGNIPAMLGIKGEEKKEEVKEEKPKEEVKEKKVEEKKIEKPKEEKKEGE
ncbi:MAG: S6e family ribosomal protein [Candidatus Aenigmatarchaeota archaeon]